ncbi:MAG: RagB/SusD family nutrient uptake outer membrane protein, partial [Chloroflexi bacterium]|nr:RagB/SusD family nutrient uptake outer membrane protein [Chloroflexota bacterium]
MQHSNTGLAPVTDATWNNAYDNIRKTNYFLQNAYRVPSSIAARHYIGEGYFTRAWTYFSLLQRYGDVPFIDKVLNVDSKELYRTRDPRDFVAGKIIQDLDSAIANLSWKGTGEAVAGRINKEAALVLKSRVALFEGSWEYYHGRKGTPFKVDGNNGAKFLEAAVAAGDILIAYQGNKIFKGPAGKEYQNYFIQLDYSTVNGAFLYKAYSQSLGIINLWYRQSVQGCDCGLTKSCIDAYLMKDGKPAGVSSIINDDKKMDALAANKDPRLGQTIFYPAKGPLSSFWSDNAESGNRYPGLIQTQQRSPSYSGYRVWKGIVFDITERDNGQTDDLIIRYEEALLNYAEAKAILGTITQTDLDKSINVIRSRVSMTAMNLATINSWTFAYNKRDGYDPTASNILNEIRRERRVE